jgi:hypothetical protein
MLVRCIGLLDTHGFGGGYCFGVRGTAVLLRIGCLLCNRICALCPRLLGCVAPRSERVSLGFSSIWQMKYELWGGLERESVSQRLKVNVIGL